MKIEPVFFKAHTLSFERPEESMHFLGRVRFQGCGESAEARGGFRLVVKVFDYTHCFEQKRREGGSEFQRQRKCGREWHRQRESGSELQRQRQTECDRDWIRAFTWLPANVRSIIFRFRLRGLEIKSLWVLAILNKRVGRNASGVKTSFQVIDFPTKDELEFLKKALGGIESL